MPRTSDRRFARARNALSCLFAAAVLSGCSSTRTVELDMKTLFTIPIGKADDEVDLLERNGAAGDEKTRLFMQDGLFYLGNGNADKVMEFSSYGDLLSLFYNPTENPPPVLLAAESSDSSEATREAHSYPLNGVGSLAVSPDKTLLIENRVQPERQEMDPKLDALLDTVILRFSDSGKYLDYLGQDGIGGSPFPYVERVQSNSRGETVVICRTPKVWFAYWFAPSGALLDRVRISDDSLPLPDQSGYVASVETMFADPDKRLLYVKLDYYRADSSSGSNGAVDFVKSSVLWLSAETDQVLGHLDLPKHILESRPAGIADTQRVEVLYQLVGIASGGFLFFLSPLQDKYYELLVLNRQGTLIRRSRIALDDRQVVFRTLFLTPSGILCGLLERAFDARVVVWRSDRLVQGLLREGS